MLKVIKDLAAKWLQPALLLYLCLLPLAGQSGRVRPSPTPTPPGEVQRQKSLPVAPAATPQEARAVKDLPKPEAPQAVDEDDIVRISSRLVGIPASVIDADGKPLTNLTADDFELLIDGTRQEFRSLDRYETPVRIVLLFDNSSSQNPARELAREAAIKFFQRVLRRQDQAAVILVSTGPRLIQPLTSNVKQLVATINNFPKPEGATALLDSVIMASSQLRLSAGRRVIVMVTDGEDTYSDSTLEQSLTAAQNADCQIYAVQTGYLENANVRRLAAERRLEEYTQQTGGAIYTPFRKADLPLAFEQIAADLAQQYIIGYYPPATQPADGALHTIALRVKNRPDARIRTRQGYYAKGRKQPN